MLPRGGASKKWMKRMPVVARIIAILILALLGAVGLWLFVW